MTTIPSLKEVAALIADESRSKILLSLLDGRLLPASELARRAHISPQTASSHLGKLVNGGLLEVEINGRNKYFRLANSNVAYAIEGLINIAPMKKVNSLRESDQTRAIKYARTCYDHLAGVVGVQLTESLLENDYISKDGRDYKITSKGTDFFIHFGVDVQKMKTSKRIFARQCLDWSERVHHCSGILGATITQRLFDFGWIKRYPHTRAVQVTREGIEGFKQTFDISLTGI